MFCGVASAFLLWAVRKAVAAALTLLRMRRFAVHYAREPFVRFLFLKGEMTSAKP